MAESKVEHLKTRGYAALWCTHRPRWAIFKSGGSWWMVPPEFQPMELLYRCNTGDEALARFRGELS